MRLYKLLSYLLDYPDADLQQDLPELRALVAEEPLDEQERAALEGFLAHIERTEALELEREYVETFDLKSQHSLHLTHHLLGDDKNRGPVLIELGEFYKAWGMETIEGELPDYLPLMLEFVAAMDSEEARMFLTRFVKMFAILATNLEKHGSAWAPLIRLLERRALLVQQAA